MKIETFSSDTGVRLRLTGELVKEAVPRFKESVLAHLESPHRALVLDMAELSYIDSSGLGALIFLHRLWTKQGRNLFLANIAPMVRKFLRTTGLLSHFECLDPDVRETSPPETEQAV